MCRHGLSTHADRTKVHTKVRPSEFDSTPSSCVCLSYLLPVTFPHGSLVAGSSFPDSLGGGAVPSAYMHTSPASRRRPSTGTRGTSTRASPSSSSARSHTRRRAAATTRGPDRPPPAVARAPDRGRQPYSTRSTYKKVCRVSEITSQVKSGPTTRERS